MLNVWTTELPAFDVDCQQRDAPAWLQMIGIGDVAHIEAEKALMGAEPDRTGRAAASARAVRLAATF